MQASTYIVPSFIFVLFENARRRQGASPANKKNTKRDDAAVDERHS